MEEMPYGARRYLNMPNGAMNAVSSWLSGRALVVLLECVELAAFSDAMSATALAWCHRLVPFTLA